MLAHPGQQRKQQSIKLPLGYSLSVALVVFAILCALVVVIAAPDGAHPQRQAAVAAPSPVLEVLRDLDTARQQLDVHNFGQVRVHLEQARSQLMDLLSAAQQQAE